MSFKRKCRNGSGLFNAVVIGGALFLAVSAMANAQVPAEEFNDQTLSRAMQADRDAGKYNAADYQRQQVPENGLYNVQSGTAAQWEKGFGKCYLGRCAENESDFFQGGDHE